MRELLKINLFALIIIWAVMGCRKDPPITAPILPVDTTGVTIECEDFPPEPIFSWSIISTGSQYKKPCFNPNDNNEMVYLREVEGSFLPELVKYNLLEENEVILCNSVKIVSQPKWGKTGWIVFHVFSGINQVWKIRDDGTGLTQLTFGLSDIFPHFNAAGDRINFFRGSTYSNHELEENPDLYLEAKMMFIDLDGAEVDSILIENIISQTKGGQFYYQNWKYADFQMDETYFIGGTDDFYGVYRTSNEYETIEELYVWDLSTAPRQDASSIAYSNDFVYYTKGKNSLYQLDVTSGSVLMMQEGCDTKNYNHVTVSPDGSKLLVEKIISFVADAETIDQQHEIWLIDIETNQENKILSN